MKTRFYKILYKNQDVVYVGVTLRPVMERFKEHLISKKLNENYSVIEFDCIEHPEFATLEIFYAERRRVAELEQKYIKEELKKGSKLLNISKGGEWGSSILEKLRKEEFYKKFGSYDEYDERKKKVESIKNWLSNWVLNRSKGKVKTWVRSWIFNRSRDRVKEWIGNWVARRKENKVKRWVRSWVSVRHDNAVKVWIKSWIQNRSKKDVKGWIRSWVKTRSRNSLKRWLKSWIHNRSKNKVKSWIRDWVKCRSENQVKVWLRSWVKRRS